MYLNNKVSLFMVWRIIQNKILIIFQTQMMSNESLFLYEFKRVLFVLT